MESIRSAIQGSSVMVAGVAQSLGLLGAQVDGLAAHLKFLSATVDKSLSNPVVLQSGLGSEDGEVLELD